MSDQASTTSLPLIDSENSNSSETFENERKEENTEAETYDPYKERVDSAVALVHIKKNMDKQKVDPQTKNSMMGLATLMFAKYISEKEKHLAAQSQSSDDGKEKPKKKRAAASSSKSNKKNTKKSKN